LVSFEFDSQLKRIESKAFSDSWSVLVLIPPGVHFIAGDSFTAAALLLLSDDSSPEFPEGDSLRQSGSRRDFQCADQSRLRIPSE
jgi:hypothetical protein